MVRTTGSRIREIRKSQGMTMAKLADTIGVSKSLISQVERGEVLPSLPTLEKITVSLNVPISEVFKVENNQIEEKQFIVRKENRKKIVIPDSSMTYYLLTPSFRENMEFLVIEVPPFADKERIDTFKHEGKEYFLILEGQLRLDLEDQSYTLNEGDSGSFDSSRKHSFKNLTDKNAYFLIAATN